MRIFLGCSIGRIIVYHHAEDIRFHETQCVHGGADIAFIGISVPCHEERAVYHGRHRQRVGNEPERRGIVDDVSEGLFQFFVEIFEHFIREEFVRARRLRAAADNVQIRIHRRGVQNLFKRSLPRKIIGKPGCVGNFEES